MNKKSAYEVYGKAAVHLSDATLISGRYAFQREVETNIVKDIIAKIHPKKSERLLEIGCGVGVLLRPLCSFVSEAVGIDHPSCISKFRKLGIPSNIKLIEGEWPKVKPNGSFDVILVYSVLQYLLDAKSAKMFIDECFKFLNPGGRLLLGDIPNVDSRKRFLSSSSGKKFERKWAILKSVSAPEHILRDKIFSATRKSGVYLGDKFIVKLFTLTRKRGFECYIMPQRADLPFSHSREDILIRRHD